MEKTVYILIGLPASGKSTWREKFTADHPEVYALSSDDIIDQKCAEAGLTYNEGFQKFIKVAGKMFDRAVKDAFEDGDSFIVDRTNMSRKSRKRFIDQANQHGYQKVAVAFIVPEDVIKQRMQKRFEETGKSVPGHVMKSMADNYDAPTKDEGFDLVIMNRS